MEEIIEQEMHEEDLLNITPTTVEEKVKLETGVVETGKKIDTLQNTISENIKPIEKPIIIEEPVPKTDEEFEELKREHISQIVRYQKWFMKNLYWKCISRMHNQSYDRIRREIKKMIPFMHESAYEAYTWCYVHNLLSNEEKYTYWLQFHLRDETLTDTYLEQIKTYSK